jgi:hypothetical protein
LLVPLVLGVDRIIVASAVKKLVTWVVWESRTGASRSAMKDTGSPVETAMRQSGSAL